MPVNIGRRELIAALGSAAAWPLAARAQSGERALRRIGVLMSFGANDPEAQSRVAAFENGLRQLGWIRGHNLSIEYRWADNPDVLRTDATELVGMAPDLILVNSTPAIAALQERHEAVPIVFTQVTDPVGEGLVLNLAHPGGHLTGFTSFEFSIGTKWLETLKEMAPRVTRVALVFNPQTAPFADLFWRPVEAVAPSFAIVAISAGARTFADLEHMVDEFAREPNGSLMVLPDVSTLNYRDALIGLAARHRLPTIYPFRIFAANGGLLSYGTDVNDVFRRVASYVDRVLKGADPGELPIQSPNKYELVINLKTANALDIQVSDRLLALANEVIE
jgi:putative tryptophan/tyrosine transport system substrate-binding protein